MALLPEWTPVDTILIAWPYPESDWSANLDQAIDCYWHMLGAFTQAAKTCVLVHPSLDIQSLQTQTFQHAIPKERVSWLECEYDDTWIRDYGPLSTEGGLISLTFNGWGQKYVAKKDNQVYLRLAEYFRKPINKYAFVGEGGALETNGEVLLMNADCVVDSLRNPELGRDEVEHALAGSLPGLKPVWLENVALSGDDTDGHIDTIARFVAPSTLVYSGRSPEHIDAAVLESLHRQIQILANEHSWKAIELPSPQVPSQLDGHVLPATYANFLIVNDCVFAPVYGVLEDAKALDLLGQVFPNRTLVPIRCEALLEQHGSLHCATMQVSLNG